MTYSNPGILLAIPLLLGSAGLVPLGHSEDQADSEKLLMEGKYAEIPEGKTSHDRAVWAFARLFLSPDKRVAEAAREAHKAGDDLGTFVLFRCHSDGFGLRRDEKEMYKLNYALREKLDKTKELSELQAYMRSCLFDGDEDGIVRTKTPDESLEKRINSEKSRWDWLVKAANSGCAQALNDMGEAYQRGDEFEKALSCFEKAAKSGLAAGCKDAGYLYSVGRGTNQDMKKALALTEEGAKRGDAFAMINMAVYFEKGMGVKEDRKEARTWIDKALANGQFMGALEKGLACYQGNYGYPKDAAVGKELFRQAINGGHRFALMQLASFYYEGIGVDKNGDKAVAFAEAAFVQGEMQAARMLAHLYRNGAEGVEKNEQLADYWSLQSEPQLAFVVGEQKSDQKIAERLSKIDPFSLEP